MYSCRPRNNLESEFWDGLRQLLFFKKTLDSKFRRSLRSQLLNGYDCKNAFKRLVHFKLLYSLIGARSVFTLTKTGPGPEVQSRLIDRLRYLFGRCIIDLFEHCAAVYRPLRLHPRLLPYPAAAIAFVSTFSRFVAG